jgi:hypothetical protein
MKRVGLLLVVLILLVTACGPSPKARTDDFAHYLPVEIGDWKLDDGETVELVSSTITSKGHMTLVYEGPDDALAYIVIDVYPSDDAAEVASTARIRELRLLGMEFDADRVPQQATAQMTQTERNRIALLDEDSIVVEIDVIAAADAEEPVSEDAFSELLTIVRNAYEKIASGGGE